MKKLNKLFLAAGSVAAIAAPVAAVVSCGAQSKETSLPLAKFVEKVTWKAGTDKNEVVAITDGGDKNDKSFNEQTWDAVSTFRTTKTRNDAAIVPSASTSASDLMRAYQKATTAKTLVMSGFLHSAPLASFSGENADKAFVFVDGAIDAQYDKLATDATGADQLQGTANPATGYTDFTLPTFANGVVKVETWATPAASAAKQLVEIKATKEKDGSFATSSEYKFAGNTLSVKTTSLKENHLKVSVTRRQSNIANLNFKSEQAGFLAGIAAAEYSKAKHSDQSVHIATFGGIAIPPVTSFMNGFVAGAHSVATDDAKLFVNGKAYAAFKAADKKSYFIGDFQRDTNGKVTVLASDLLKDADVIMPVGAAQEFTVLDAIKKTNNQDKRVIGVDTDMYGQVNADEQKFVLTSATKSINEAITQTLDRLYGVNTPSTVVTETGAAVLGKDYNGGLANNWVGLGKVNDTNVATELEKFTQFGTFKAADNTFSATAAQEQAIEAEITSIF